MSRSDEPDHATQVAGSFWKSRAGIVLIGFLAVAGLMLAYEHRVHLFTENALLIVLLALCVGMHFFMHGGHGGHGHDDGRQDGGR